MAGAGDLDHLGDVDDLDAAIGALYGGPAEEFVASRRSLAAALRAAGRRDEAADVAKLRKPTRTAWALDAAVAADPPVVARLASAAAAMADAQSSGGDVRGAMADLRSAVRDVAAAGSRAAGEGGHPVDAADLAPAVLAVVGDSEALDALRAGRLVDISPAGGLGLAAPVPAGATRDRAPEQRATRPLAAERAPAKRAPEPASTGEAPRGGRATAAARRKVERAEAEAAVARDAVEAAEAALDEATAEASETADAARRAAEVTDAADERLRAAEREARAARDERASADRSRIAAGKRLERAQRKADDARQRRSEAEEALADVQALLDDDS